MVDPASTAMEFGGYVEPPSHLTKKAGAVPAGLAAELRTIPDYDYSLFRYSRLALPFLLLIAASAALLFCLTCWQGPLGIRTPVNGIFDGVPYDYQISNDGIQGGIRNGLRNLRIANFVLGVVPFIISVFAIMARPRPTFLRIWLIIAAICFFALWISAAVAFAIGLAEVNRGYECERLRLNYNTPIPGVTAGNGNTNQEVTASPDPLDCEGRIQLTTANDVADIFLSTISFLTAFAIVWSILTKNYAWGPGVVAIHKQVDTPKVSFPPPSPFTHIHETRRLYVWFLLFVFIAALIIDFTLTIMVHDLRTVITPVDNFNRRPLTNTNFHEQYTLDFTYGTNPSKGVTALPTATIREPRLRGWATTNNRFRLALSSFIFGLAMLQIMDLVCWKRRFVAYVLAVLFFFAAFTCIVIFAMDVHDVNKARKQLRCPTNLRVNLFWVEPGKITPRPKTLPVGPVTSTKVAKIRCSQWQYFATCFVEFFLFVLLAIWIIYEFLFRCLATWDTFYFYADSEWLRNHSLFVEVTDREAYDWQRFTMETGRDYYYSPTLGISTRTRPRNYIDPVVPVPVY